MLFFEIGPGRYVNLHDCSEVLVNAIPHPEPDKVTLTLIYPGGGTYPHEITKDRADALRHLLGPSGIVIGRNFQQVATEIAAEQQLVQELQNHLLKPGEVLHKPGEDFNEALSKLKPGETLVSRGGPSPYVAQREKINNRMAQARRTPPLHPGPERSPSVFNEEDRSRITAPFAAPIAGFPLDAQIASDPRYEEFRRNASELAVRTVNVRPHEREVERWLTLKCGTINEVMFVLRGHEPTGFTLPGWYFAAEEQPHIIGPYTNPELAKEDRDRYFAVPNPDAGDETR